MTTGPSYRVRYAVSPARGPRSPAEVRTLDVVGTLAVGEAGHWTRWPLAIRLAAGDGIPKSAD